MPSMKTERKTKDEVGPSGVIKLESGGEVETDDGRTSLTGTNFSVCSFDIKLYSLRPII